MQNPVLVDINLCAEFELMMIPGQSVNVLEIGHVCILVPLYFSILCLCVHEIVSTIEKGCRISLEGLMSDAVAFCLCSCS